LIVLLLEIRLLWISWQRPVGIEQCATGCALSLVA
jgi:hypothetical protein